MTDHVINTALTIAAGVFLANGMNRLRSVGADLWAAIVLALAATEGLRMPWGHGPAAGLERRFDRYSALLTKQSCERRRSSVQALAAAVAVKPPNRAR